MNKSTQVVGVASVALGAIFTKWLSIHLASLVPPSREWVGSGYEYGDQDSSAQVFAISAKSALQNFDIGQIPPYLGP